MSSEPTGVARPSSWCRRSASHAPPVRIPTRPVDSETLARSLPASSRQRASASGRFIEVALKNDLRGERVHLALMLAAAPAALAQGLFGGRRREPLVRQHDRKAKARLELAREPARAPRHLVLPPVEGEGKSDQQARRAPFA